MRRLSDDELHQIEAQIDGTVPGYVLPLLREVRDARMAEALRAKTGRRAYDTTLARIAGNIASGLVGKMYTPNRTTVDAFGDVEPWARAVVETSTTLAREIVAELEDAAKGELAAYARRLESTEEGRRMLAEALADLRARAEGGRA